MRAVELIFEKSSEGRQAYSLPALDVPEQNLEEMIPSEFLRHEAPALPEVSEVDVVRHFTQLSQLNFGVDTGFYPLGSCTMKYNPKINEHVAGITGLSALHPYQPQKTVQGALKLLYDADQMLSEITGMAKMSLQPAAGAHGELAGSMIIKAYHEHNGEGHRNIMIVPDSAHGTNPATAAVLGYKTVEVRSNERGTVDVEALKQAVNENVAGLMLTNPNTLGIFEDQIEEIAKIIHEAGGLLYYDGANINPIMGTTSPGDMGFDIVHLNLHKTFSTPHGGGGPGSGPIGVCERLVPFLPKPVVAKKEDTYYLDYDLPLSIGPVRSFYGNFGVIVKAYAYILTMGPQGLQDVADNATLNANYVMRKLQPHYHIHVDRICMHEFIASGQWQLKENGVSTLDIAKRLLDYGFHPPTVYFPLIVKEALMIEPTETESKQTLDAFVEAMIAIAQEAKDDPDKVKNAPHSTVVSRLDEVGAARKPVVRWTKS